MSHKTVCMAISSEKLCGKFDEETVKDIVARVMARYVEETAKDEEIKCDWYSIGGRWAGSFAALKGTQNVLPAEEGRFAYELFDKYDVVVNYGKQGPYKIDDAEYIPVNGALKKDIAWDAVSKFDKYVTYRMLRMILEGDPRIGGVPAGYEIRENKLYVHVDGTEIHALTVGESFEVYAKARNMVFGRAVIPLDAYIDKDGVWHDDNEIWDIWMRQLMGSKGKRGLPTNPEEAAYKEFRELFEKYLDNELKDDDGFLVLDCHCFP